MLSALLRLLCVASGFIRRPDLIVRYVRDHPDRARLEVGVVYVVGDKRQAKWAYFLCPSGSGEVFQLSLQPNRRPRWRVSADALGRATLDPSVRQLDGPYAHFWVRGGHVSWCADSGKPPMFGEHEAV
jgi:hypothetical protein